MRVIICFMVMINAVLGAHGLTSVNKETITPSNIFRNNSIIDVQRVPDSIATAEQIELKMKLMKLFVDKVVCENNRLLLTATTEDFTANDIPAEYLAIISKDLDDANAGAEQQEAAGAILNLSEALTECKKLYSEYITQYSHSPLSFSTFMQNR